MATFDGIPLLGPAGTGGAVLFLRDRPKLSAIATLAGGVEVEIREGVLGAVVRGVPGANYEAVMSQAVELLNRGLDVFALRGLGAASLDGTGGIRIAYWESAQEKCVRLWARMDAALFTSGTAVVRAPDGSIKEEPEPTVLAWQESMRYYRM